MESIRQVQVEMSVIAARITSLTPREREVLTDVVACRMNKQIAVISALSRRRSRSTVAWMMEKLGVCMVADHGRRGVGIGAKSP